MADEITDRIHPSVSLSAKVNIWALCRPLPPLFLLLLPHPNSPLLQTTSPPSKKTSPSSQHKKSYFLKFCGHNIRILIYRWILSVFVSNSIFLNFNIQMSILLFFSICILLVYVHVLLLFLKQTCSIWIWFVLDFVKLYLFVNCWNFIELPNYMCCFEIINSLFNRSVLIFINGITEL